MRAALIFQSSADSQGCLSLFAPISTCIFFSPGWGSALAFGVSVVDTTESFEQHFKLFVSESGSPAATDAFTAAHQADFDRWGFLMKASS